MPIQYIIPFLTAFIVAFSLIPLLRTIAISTQFVDRPSSRKIHAAPIPMLGGVAMFAATVVSLLAFDGWSPRSAAVTIGGTLLVAVGLLDDWFKTRGQEFPVWPRMIAYSLVSGIPVLFGIRIEGITNPDGGMLFFPEPFIWIGTMLWVFAMLNMINFLDGIDGLASGIVTISSLALLAAAVIRGTEGPAVFAAILAGSCLAFLAFNFHPAKIFMGDAGAVFLGYSLAVLAVDGALKVTTVVSLAVPLLALGVPILDTVIVFTRRILNGQGLHRADKLHTHHSLMKWGLSQTQTVSFLYLVGTLFSLLSILVLLLFR